MGVVLRYFRRYFSQYVLHIPNQLQQEFQELRPKIE